MKARDYEKQVILLLSVLPVVANETCFALHGGTAINMFYSPLPRLSVDIDLTYLPVDNRVNSMIEFNAALKRIATRVEKTLPGTKVQHRHSDAKLLISNSVASIMVEVNTVKRGCFSAPEIKTLCDKAQQYFGVFCEMTVVNKAHLFGGKIWAALDRQHPRDLFDIRQILKTHIFDNELKKGFIFYLLSSARPLSEMLFPNLTDQRQAFENQFIGMTKQQFNYADYETTRLIMIEKIHSLLTFEDKQFLVQFEQGVPDWRHYDFSSFPAVQWKLLNINQLKAQNPAKYHNNYLNLEMKLYLKP